MSLPDKCPFCGAGVRAMKDGDQRWVEFECFSQIGNVCGEFQYRSPICRHAELNAAKARVAELEARCKRLEEAGDAHMEWVPVSFQGAWRAAKEAKP